MIKIQKNIFLSKYTSFKIGGPARRFCVVKNNDEIKEALEFAGKNKLRVFILGGGSNLLISDEGFDGIVIRIMNDELRITNNEIFVGSGASLMKLVNESVKNNLTGLEWAAGIPGTVGGAVVNNAGAFGKCMGDVMEEIEILEIGKLGNKEIGNWKLDIKKLNNKQCNFSYRSSIFKEDKNYIILNAVLKLKQGNKEESKKIIAEILKSRREKQPLEYPSAGSVFKNPIIDNEHSEKLKKEFPELKNSILPYPVIWEYKNKRNSVSLRGVQSSEYFTIPAGWLIDQIDELKNKKIGGVMISEKHCNFIVNFNNAKAEDVVILISLVKQKVRSKFNIQLKEEIEFVGF